VAHAHHFLERLDRITREQTEFALALYRDHEAVRFVLDHVTLPPGAARVAFAIDDPREGPFVLVTVPEGRFVTCLGRGMHHQHPVVERARIDALLAKVADGRARREMAQRDLRPDEDQDDVLERVIARGSRFSREDFVAVSAFLPLLGDETWRLMLDFSLEALKARQSLESHVVALKRPTERDRMALRALDRIEWAVAHLTMLACAGDRRDLDALAERGSPLEASLTYGCSAQGGTTFFLRSAWASARLGRPILGKVRDALAAAKDWIAMMDAAMGLGAIALRHAAARNEARRILEQYEPPAAGAAGGPDDMRALFARQILSAIDEADTCVDGAMFMGRDLVVQLGSALPEGHALRYATSADVPDDLARTAALWFDADVMDVKGLTLAACALPLAARASPEDFYLPREHVRAWLGAWQPDETIERVRRAQSKRPKLAPVQATKPGRNDPCPCGSGKKWKKCHGLTGAPL
jgi:hypothetical protein